MTPAAATPVTAPARALRERVDATDWAAVSADLDAYGCALTGPLLLRPA